MAQAKLRRWIEAVGIDAAVRASRIPRSTLLSLRLGTLADPKVSQAIALEDAAGVSARDWVTPIPALRSA